MQNASKTRSKCESLSMKLSKHKTQNVRKRNPNINVKAGCSKMMKRSPSCLLRRRNVMCGGRKPKSIKGKTQNEDIKQSDESSLEIVELTEVEGKPCAVSRMPCDRRKMRKIRLFDPPSNTVSGQKANKTMLERAKRKIIKELTRQQQAYPGVPSPLEQAFMDASQESFLSFDYDGMKSLVRNARFGDSRDEFLVDDDAYNDNTNIVLNQNIPFVESEISRTLLHECLHNTVERAGKPGNPQLSEKTEHVAMALLGDREEQFDYFQTYFNLDYVNESWMKVAQRKKRRLNPKYLTNVYDYEVENSDDDQSTSESVS